MKSKMIGSWLVLLGTIMLIGTIYLYPPGGIPGSYNSPMKASSFQTSNQMMTMAENSDGKIEYYIEVNDFMVASQSTNEEITPMLYQQGTHYKQSYIYKDSLTSSEYITLSQQESILGIWDVPRPYFFQTMTLSGDIYGDMEDALNSTKTDALIDMGYNGEGTIVVIPDEYPDEDEFYDIFPSRWRDRVIHYPDSVSNGIHGIMTAGVVAGVSPEAKLYLMDFADYYDPLVLYQNIINLKDTYPDYDIICSNSYGWSDGTGGPGTPWFDPSHPINRKTLEIVENDIVVLFAAGNYAHPGEHTSSWTLEVGNSMYYPKYPQGQEIGYPAVFDEIISVAGCNAYGDKIISYSSMGRGVDNHNEPDVSAPTHHYYEYSPYSGMTSGTSASCPFMAGICANILSGKSLDTDRMVGSITTYSKDVGDSGFDEEFGYGVIDSVAVFNNYDLWVPSPEDIPDVSMYTVSLSMLMIGIIVYNKQNILKIIGG